MIDTSKIQDGDRFLSAGTAWISKQIIHYMTLYRDKFPVVNGVKNLLSGFVASHCATFFWIDGVLYLYGSIDWGYKPIVFTDHYSENDSWIILRTKDGYTDGQKKLALNYAMVSMGGSTIYPYWALPMWILYVKTGWKWVLNGGGQKAQVCYKSVYQVLRQIEPYKYSLNPLYVTFFDSIRSDDQIIIDNRK